MTKKLTRKDAAKLLQLSLVTLQRLEAITRGSGLAVRPDLFEAWRAAEYTEQDNLLFRLFVALKELLPDSSSVFIALRKIWVDIDELVRASHRSYDMPGGVVVIGDGRYVRWPPRGWLDLWAPDRVTAAHEIEPSLRITTAIHLQAMLQPLQEAE